MRFSFSSEREGKTRKQNLQKAFIDSRELIRTKKDEKPIFFFEKIKNNLTKNNTKEHIL